MKHLRRLSLSQTAAAVLSAAALTGSLSPAVRAQSPAANAATGTLYPFVIPWDDAAPGTATDVSFLNDGPAGAHGGHVVIKNGHFVEEKTGKRVRFIGTNFTFDSDFPTHEDAEKVAAHIAKLGINIVRIHHHDIDHSPLWDKKFGDHRHFDPAALDRLDYLIYQLKQHGVYVDLNLHVSRFLTSADGLPPSADTLDKIARGFDYDKRVDRFDRLIIARQKEFAHDYLGHVNPYTHQSYANDPCVAIVEINNENSLVSDAATNFAGQLAELPEPYKGELVGLWNDWLLKKYGTDAKLQQAWAGGVTKPGPSVITPASKWTLEHQGEAKAMLSPLEGIVPPDSPPVAVHVTNVDGTDWHVQAHVAGLNLHEGDTYTVRFEAKADKPRLLPVHVRLDEADWHNAGLDATARVTTEWQPFTYVFTATNTVPDHERLSFVLGGQAGTVSLRGVTLSPGVPPGVSTGEGSLAAKTVALPSAGTRQVKADWVRFLCDTERAYAEEMRGYLKKDLGVHANLIDTQISWSNSAGPYREQSMDFADNHAYWEHPQFPGKPWDSVNWTVANTPLVAALAKGQGTLPQLAEYRIAGKPYTVTEYNEPAPNDFQAETVPELAAFAAAQDWDGFFLFDYGSYGAHAANDKIQGFFAIGSNPAKTAFLPAAALLFRGEALPPLEGASTLQLTEDEATSALPLSRFWQGEDTAGKSRARISFGDTATYSATAKASPSDKDSVKPKTQPAVFMSKLAVQYIGAKRPQYQGAARGIDPGSPATGLLVSNTFGGVFVAERQRRKPDGVYGCAAGFFGGQNVQIGGATIAVKPFGDNFCALALTPTGPDKKSLLVTLVGKVENSGMGWNAARTSVGSQWGSGPTLAEFVPATVTIPNAAKGAKVWALDGSGRRMKEVPSTVARDGALTFTTTPDAASLWYEVAVGR